MKCKRCPLTAHRRGLCRKHYDHWRRSQPRGTAPAQPVREHLQRLLDAGMTQDKIAEIAGVSRVSTVKALLDPGRESLRTRTAAKILSIPVPIPTPDADISRLIPVTGTRRRLQALVRNGYPQKDLAARMGVVWQTVSEIVNDKKQFVRVDVAQAAAAIFRELELIPGGDRRAELWGQRRGWLPPFSWDEDSIDDPNAEPMTVNPERDFASVIADHRFLGRTDDEIAEKMGVTLDNLHTRMRRHGISRGRRYRDIEDFIEMQHSSMSKKALKVA